MALNDLYSPKQIEILKRTRAGDWFMLVNHGAKRSGKTVLDNDLFLFELRQVRRIADSLGIETPMYILAGYTLGNIQDNILTELSNKYGIKFKFDKFNNFVLLGVKVVQVPHGSIPGLGKVRGMTAFGAYINEASLANELVFDEIKARCSGPGARIICDTNPDHPEHWLLKDYIQSSAKGILSYQFSLFDNTFLDKRYKQNIIATTPKGMFYDRGIKGLWVSGNGVVYPGFDKNVHAITRNQADKIQFERYLCGADWGYEHFGAIVVIGVLNGAYYIIEEHAYQHKYIEDWVQIAQGIVKRYGDIPFYCDSARPEHVVKFQDSGLNAINANKRILSGVEEVATLMNVGCFFIVYDEAPRFRQEIYNYIWNPITGEPKDGFDDVLDAIRYGIYTDTIVQGMEGANVKDTISMFSQLGL